MIAPSGWLIPDMKGVPRNQEVFEGPKSETCLRPFTMPRFGDLLDKVRASCRAGTSQKS